MSMEYAHFWNFVNNREMEPMWPRIFVHFPSKPRRIRACQPFPTVKTKCTPFNQARRDRYLAEMEQKIPAVPMGTAGECYRSSRK